MARQRKQPHFGPTQKDIADALGVSQSTVAVALGNDSEGKLMIETIARIRDYAAKVGYRPQRSAQIMRGKKTRIIGVVARMGFYFSNQKLVQCLANALNRMGYVLVLVDPTWFDGDMEAVRNYLLDQVVEGVIFCNLVPRTGAQAMKDLLPPTLPVLSLSSSLEDAPNLRVDTHSAFYQLTRYHMALGSQQLGCLSMFRDAGTLLRSDWSTRDRVTGFAQAIMEAGGIVLADAVVQELLEIRGCKTELPEAFDGVVGTIIYPERHPNVTNAYEHGFREMLKLAGRDEIPDSLICMNDDVALGVLAACADRGICVPERIRISGYDDSPASPFGAIPLTTVRKPFEQLSQRAVELMLECIQNPKRALNNTLELMPGEIVVRRSTGTMEENSRLLGEGFFEKTEGRGGFHFAPFEERLEQFSADFVNS